MRGIGYTSLAPVLCHYTVFPIQLYQCRYTPSPAPATRYNISIGLHKTNLSFTFSFGLQFSSVQSLSCVQLFVTLWTAALQASLSITNSQSSLKLMSIESVVPSNHLILCRPFLLLPLVFPSIRALEERKGHPERTARVYPSLAYTDQ